MLNDRNDRLKKLMIKITNSFSLYKSLWVRQTKRFKALVFQHRLVAAQALKSHETESQSVFDDRGQLSKALSHAAISTIFY
jgi:hypothetical protein